MAARYAKILFMLIVAAFAGFVTFNNVIDYGTNFFFMKHVLSMDTTFPDNKLMWRAITSPLIHHVAYICIIAVEAAVAILALLGARALFHARGDAAAFEKAKSLSVVALTLGVALWFGGFITVGGEWFVMWQSNTANGTQPAFQFSALLLLVLVFLQQKEE